MEVTGKLVKILDLEQKGTVITKHPGYEGLDNGNEFNNLTAVSAFGNKNVEQLGRLELGMDVAILCNVYSREYQGKYYHNIDGYHFTDQSARVAHEADE